MNCKIKQYSSPYRVSMHDERFGLLGSHRVDFKIPTSDPVYFIHNDPEHTLHHCSTSYMFAAHSNVYVNKNLQLNTPERDETDTLCYFVDTYRYIIIVTVYLLHFSVS